jgi:hypothetical protein
MILLQLEDISQILKGISKSFGDYMAECTAVCLYSQNHNSNVVLKVFDENDTEIESGLVKWSISINDDIIKSNFDEKRATDFGAMGLSLLITKASTDYTTFISSETNNGVDFWLLKDDDNDLNFFSARLEVSGIRKETKDNSIKKRLKIKEKQILKSSRKDIPCYISIIEFSTPKALFIKK